MSIIEYGSYSNFLLDKIAVFCVERMVAFLMRNIQKNRNDVIKT
jgi:hypothetical protein